MVKKIFGILSIGGVIACLLEFTYAFYKQKMYTSKYFIGGLIIFALTILLAAIVGNLKDDSQEKLKKLLMNFVLLLICVFAALFVALYVATAVKFNILGITTAVTIVVIGITIALCINN